MVEGIVAAFARERDRRAGRVDRRQRRRFRARWSTASCRRPPTPTSPRRTRLLGVHDAAPVVAERVRAVGHRGPLRRRASRVGGRRRAVRRRRRAVRNDEAAPAQRQPLDTRLSGLPDAARLRVAGRRATRCSPRSSSARWPRRSSPTLVRPAGTDLDAYCGAADAALSQRRAAAPHAADRDGRVAEAAAAPAGHRARPHHAPAPPTRISRSRSPAGSVTPAAPTSRAAASTSRIRWRATFAEIVARRARRSRRHCRRLPRSQARVRRRPRGALCVSRGGARATSWRSSRTARARRWRGTSRVA